MNNSDLPILAPFNPLDKRNLAESVTDAMLDRPVSPLPPAPFIGFGIYAIYYIGSFPLYHEIARRNAGLSFNQPIYVGKAWIPLAESLLIEKFSPLWNKVLDGFGNHDPGGGRARQQKSPWDTLHPGRAWAVKLQPNSNDAQTIELQVKAFIDKHYC